MNINWYPGHMAKAKRLIAENLKLVDIVIELLDARIPQSSMNPDFEKLIGEKKRFIVLNKADFADQKVNNEWIRHFNCAGEGAVLLNSINMREVNIVRKKLVDVASDMREAIKAKKRINKTIRAMIIGIPNVGKSTFINSLIGKQKAKVGDKPGVTKVKQWVKIDSYFEVLDTPGMLWPNLQNKTTALHLAYTGSIKQEILDMESIVFNFLEELKLLYPEFLIDRYKLDSLEGDGYNLLNQICLNRGWIVSGGSADVGRGGIQIIRDFQTGNLGKISLEQPIQ